MLGSLGVAGLANPLGLEPAARACLLLLDGLGWELLCARKEAAPFLNSSAGESLTAGFPSTTATSISLAGDRVAAGGARPGRLHHGAFRLRPGVQYHDLVALRARLPG